MLRRTVQGIKLIVNTSLKRLAAILYLKLVVIGFFVWTYGHKRDME